MSVQTFHYVQQQSENFYDMMTSDKKKLKLWSRRLHLAVLAYRELFMTLSAMDKSPDGLFNLCPLFNKISRSQSNLFFRYRPWLLKSHQEQYILRFGVPRVHPDSARELRRTEDVGHLFERSDRNSTYILKNARDFYRKRWVGDGTEQGEEA